MAQPHLAYPDLTLDKFSATDPDQDAETFIHLIECKNNFALGTEPGSGDLELVVYLFRKKPCSPGYYEDLQLNGMEALFKMH